MEETKQRTIIELHDDEKLDRIAAPDSLTFFHFSAAGRRKLFCFK